MRALHIMIIDDDPMFPLLLKHAWSKFCANFKISLFRDGIDALDYLTDASAHPDIIFLDLYTLGMDGRDFLKAYKTEFQDGPFSPIYTVTASLAPEDLHLAEFEPYLSGCLQKPIVAENLKRIINSHSNLLTANMLE